MDESKQIIVLRYVEDYRIYDDALYEPFIVLRSVNDGAPAWWNGASGRNKVQKLINAFRIRSTAVQACVQAVISVRQYKYFCEVHPTFRSIRDRLYEVLPSIAKQGYAVDMAMPENVAMRERFLMRTEPEIYNPAVIRTTKSPLAEGQVLELEGDPFIDVNGDVVVPKEMADYIEEKYGPDDTTQDAPESGV